MNSAEYGHIRGTTMNTRIGLGIFALTYLMVPVVHAAEGAVVVRLDDGQTSRCINTSTDQVWLSMRRVVLNKKAGLLTEDKYAGIVVTTTISGNTGARTAKVTFPRMIEADMERYAFGDGIAIPVEFALLEGLQLKNGNDKYTNVSFDFNVVKSKQRNAWGQALNSLVSISS